MMQANTGVRFETKDPLLSQLVKQAEEKCRLNIKNFGGDPVLVEGGGYEKIWLETQCNLVRRTEKGRLRRRGWGLRWEKAQKGGKGTNLRGFFED